ncbi:CsbD family protein [Streptomyces sp. NPDC048717]|uniref:CsbD family protein n=1 Tax=Streptomyces sp. NPDC048717 TaxID=3154928 RepID=UPI00344860CC
MGKAKGKAKQAKGAMKETMGKASGDTGTEVRGHVEKLAGKAEEAAADAKRKSGGR